MGDTGMSERMLGWTRFPLGGGRAWYGYVAALFMAGLAVMLRTAIDGVMPPGFPFLTVFPAVILTTFVFGLGPGITVAALGGLSAWYFFIAPANSFALTYGALVALAFYVFITAVEIGLIHGMQWANARLDAERRSNAQLAQNRELLFRELQHRVGNNLQMVGSLINLQKRGLTDPAAIAALDDSARRLQTVGRVQRSLYDPDGAQLDLYAYLEKLVADVIGSAGREGLTHSVTAAEPFRLPPDAAIPTALVVSESVSNALEHGLAGRDGGHIDVSISRTPDQASKGEHLRIAVTDDGKGVPPDFDGGGQSLGLKICHALASGLGGRFVLEPRGDGGRGASAALLIPI